MGREAPSGWINAVVGSTRDCLVDGPFVGSAKATWAKGSIWLFRIPVSFPFSGFSKIPWGWGGVETRLSEGRDSKCER